jgi:hypothetical protein
MSSIWPSRWRRLSYIITIAKYGPTQLNKTIRIGTPHTVISEAYPMEKVVMELSSVVGVERHAVGREDLGIEGVKVA